MGTGLVLRAVAGSLALLRAFAGCAASGAPAVDYCAATGGAPAVRTGLRPIIKWSDPGLDRLRSGQIQQLGHESGVVLRHVRPKSGDAHVFQVEGITDAAPAPTVIDERKARPETGHAEIDRRLRNIAVLNTSHFLTD